MGKKKSVIAVMAELQNSEVHVGTHAKTIPTPYLRTNCLFPTIGHQLSFEPRPTHERSPENCQKVDCSKGKEWT